MEKVSEIWAKCLVVQNHVVTLIPVDILDTWDPDDFLPKPDVEVELEWVYGYQASGEQQSSNLLYLRVVRTCSCVQLT